jgi:hypothetical protein
MGKDQGNFPEYERDHRATPLRPLNAHEAYAHAARLGEASGIAPILSAEQRAQLRRAGSGYQKPQQDAADGPDPIGPGDEVIFEFKRKGAFVHVSVMHAPTLIEVSVAAPASTAERDLRTLALAKLRYVLRRRRRKRG